MQKYSIHDNGGVPFVVVIQDNIIQVFKFSFWNNTIISDRRISEMMKKQEGYNDLVLTINNPLQVWIGKNSRCMNDPNGHPGDCPGNSILIHESKNYYICIEWKIIRFQSEDPIVEYYSPISNNDVCYPTAVTSGNKSLLMLEYVSVDNPADFKRRMDEYALFSYSLYHDKERIGTTFEKAILHERLE
jgi:hypothetical protein